MHALRLQSTAVLAWDRG